MLPHVDFIKRRQHGSGVLRILQSLRDLQSHPVHLHPLFGSGPCDLGRGILRWHLWNTNLFIIQCEIKAMLLNFTLTVAASNDCACLMAATGIVVAGAAGLGGAAAAGGGVGGPAMVHYILLIVKIKYRRLYRPLEEAVEVALQRPLGPLHLLWVLL